MQVSTQSISFVQTPLLAQQPRQSRAASRPQMQTQAFFGRKSSTAVVEKEEAPPAKAARGGLFGTRSSSTTTSSKPAAKQQKASSKIDKAAEYSKRQGRVGSVLSALDFAEVRSKSDAELLYDAKYGKLDNGKMSREQYRALRRRVGGTAKDYWKDWVDVKGENVDRGYVAKDGSSTSNTTALALPLGIGVLVALLGTTAFVVSQTS